MPRYLAILNAEPIRCPNEMTQSQLPAQPTMPSVQTQGNTERDRRNQILKSLRQASGLEALMSQTVTIVSQSLGASRVLLYRFENASKGQVVQEAIAPGWTPAQGATLPCLAFGPQEADAYAAQEVVELIRDQSSQLTPYQRQLLEKYQVQSSVAIGIRLSTASGSNQFDPSGQVWGLLVVQQCDQQRQWQEWELDLLQQVALELTLALQPTQLRSTLAQQLEREQALGKIVQKLQQSRDVYEIFRATTQETRRVLKADRVVVYRFNEDWSGTVVAESVGSGWVSVMEIQQRDPSLYTQEMSTDERCNLLNLQGSSRLEKDTYFVKTQGSDYTQGDKVKVINDVYEAGYSPCYLESLEKYQAKAYIIAPIFQNEKLWGLFGAYQNSGPRAWSASDVNLMLQLSNPLGVALQQADYIAQQQLQLERERAVAQVIQKIQQATEPYEIFRAVTQETRRILTADRVVVYRFNEDWSGAVVAESVGTEWVSVIDLQQQDSSLYTQEMSTDERCNLLNLQASSMVEKDTYLAQTQGGDYAQGNKVKVINDVYEAGYSPCYLESLKKYQAKAYILAPIFLNEKLWGLFGAYQNSGPRAWSASDVNLMLQLSNPLGVALQQADYIAQQQLQLERERAIAQVIQKVQQETDPYEIFRAVTQETRKVLKADRVVVYRFNKDWSGAVVAESVGTEWVSVIDLQQQDSSLYTQEMSLNERCNLLSLTASVMVEKDTYLARTQGGDYRQGNKVKVINDVYKAGYSPCYLESLEKYQAKAYVLAPIFLNEKLWGLFGAYQNSGPRVWSTSDVNLMLQLSNPLGVALQQADYIAQLQTQSEQMAKAAEQEKAIAQLTERIRNSRDLKNIFRTTTQAVRRLLNSDRVVIYRFNPDWSGEVLAESVGNEWVSVIEIQQVDSSLYSTEMTTYDRCTLRDLKPGLAVTTDTYLRETQGGAYTRGERVKVINDVYEAGYSACYLESLEKYQAKAYVIAPIFQNEKLWGLFATYQNDGARNWVESDVNLMLQLSTPLGLAIQQAEYIAQLEAKSNRERGLARLVDRLQRSESLERVFQIATQEARKLLEVEQVSICRFNPDWSGEFVANSTASGAVKSMKGIRFESDVDLQDTQGGVYRNHECWVANHLEPDTLEGTHLEVLEPLDTKAAMVAPIFVGDHLWGLVGVYQQLTPRLWEEAEVSTLQQVALQIGSALKQMDYLEQLRRQSESLAQAAEREKAAKEKLQQRAIEMLTAVKPAFRGDLTVRATVTEDEIGTIAGAYNTTLDALREIVLQVQTSAVQVTQTTGDSAVSIEKLANQAQQQFQELNQTLSTIQAMVEATEATTENAQQVDVALQQANQTLQAGDKAMNDTVESILAIRQNRGRNR